MLDILDKATAEDKNIIIPADLNFDYKFDKTLCSNPVLQMENLYGMTQIITKPTGVMDKSSTLIDVILTTMPELHTNTGVSVITLSDHFLIYTYINMPSKANHHKTVWWRHQMEILSALLAICAGNSPVPGEFPAQRPVTRSFDVFFDLYPNKRLCKQAWGWWFETPSCPLWRHRNC